MELLIYEFPLQNEKKTHSQILSIAGANNSNEPVLAAGSQQMRRAGRCRVEAPRACIEILVALQEKRINKFDDYTKEWISWVAEFKQLVLTFSDVTLIRKL